MARLSLATVLACLSLVNTISGAATGSPNAKSASNATLAMVAVHQAATVSGDFFTLGDIADVVCQSKQTRSIICQAVMGRSPLAGTTRQINTGVICLKLRQAGFDPNQVRFSGASTVQISFGAGPPASNPPSVVAPGTSASVPAQPDTSSVHSGDTVDLVLQDGAVTVATKATAIENGQPGQRILLRRDGAEHSLSGIVVDSQTVRLEED